MSRNVYSAQIGLVTAAGNVNIIYPKTLASNVSYTNARMTGVSNVNGALDWLTTGLDNISGDLDGFIDSETEFNSDGSITTTYDDKIKTTTFNNDGSITETLEDPTTHIVYKTKTTIFNADGSIEEVIS